MYLNITLLPLLCPIRLPLSALRISSTRDERRLPIESIRLLVAMRNLVFKRNWKKAEQLSSQSRARAFSMLSILEGEYRMCVREMKLREETCEHIVMTENEMLKDENFVTTLKKSGLLSEFKRAVINRKSFCEGIQNEFPFLSSWYLWIDNGNNVTCFFFNPQLFLGFSQFFG
jgi:hypothetical protein